MMKFRENEDAVSPVIGVILMVAITVILAAVIAAFVFGMADTVDTKPRNVAATAQLSGDYVVATYHGGPDHDEVESATCLMVKAGDQGGKNLVTTNATIAKSPGAGEGQLKVGYKWSINATQDVVPGNVTVVTISAKFSDGTEKVILDTNIKVPN